MALRFLHRQKIFIFLKKSKPRFLGLQKYRWILEPMEILDLLHTWISTVPVHNTRVSQRVYCINVKKINCNTLQHGAAFGPPQGGFHPPYWQPGPRTFPAPPQNRRERPLSFRDRQRSPIALPVKQEPPQIGSYLNLGNHNWHDFLMM